MVSRSNTPRSERAAVLTAAVLVHLSLFALLAWAGATNSRAVRRPESMSLIALVPEAAQGKPPPPALPSKLIDSKPVVPADSFSAELDPTPLGASSGCTTFDLVSRSLAGEPAIAAALLKTPRDRRSIADAVVIWNAEWSDTARSPDDPLGPARAAIEQILRSVADTCLDEPVAGPRLVPIPEGDQTMFLAIGSGSWTWRQLLTDPDPALQPAPQLQDRANLLLQWFGSNPTKR